MSYRSCTVQLGSFAGRLLRYALLLAMPFAVLLSAQRATAYNCTGTPWQTITVSPSSNIVGASSNYTIATTVPALDGCDITLSSHITITFPGATNTTPVTGATFNGTPVSNIITQSGTSFVFQAPVGVANNAPLTIIINTITNDSTGGSKTLSMSASSVQSGSIANTTSSPYTLAVPTATFTPSLTPTPTLTNTPTLSATPTLTPTTQTNTPTATITSTPTPGFCTLPLASNGCIPGGGSKKTDCTMELLSTPVPVPGKSGVPKAKLVCYEGDPKCDFDANLTNKSCTFHARVCINSADPRLP
ncbi:MAG: hypothetical protein HY270_07435, partial [Deltaproteobacteria bacterium]|nr:hypothetical protein [Deltaproteobacteria bacterium]